MGVIETRTNASGVTSYRTKIRLKGFPPQNATFERKMDAKKWMQDTESAIREGRYFKTIKAKKHTFGEMLERYRNEVLAFKQKSTENQRHYLKWWEEQLSDYTLIDVTSDLITQTRNKLLGKENEFGRTIGIATANRYMTALGHVFSIAINEWGWLESNPVHRIKKFKEPRGRVRFLDKDIELPRLLDACRASNNPHLYTIVVLALSTGARKNEILGLCWDDVDFVRQQIILHETKNGERRVIPLRGRAWELLTAMHGGWIKKVEDERCKYIFSSEQKCQPIEIKTAWENALIRAKIQDFRFHDLRHTCASYLAMNQSSIAEIAEVLGHKTLQMVKRYAHLTEAHTHSVVEKMNEKFLSEI